MSSLAGLAEIALWRMALADDVSPVIALVADCLLRAFVNLMALIQTIQAFGLLGTGIVVVPYLFAPETSHIALVVSVAFLLHLFFLLLFLDLLQPVVFLLDAKGCLMSLQYLLLQVGGLCFSLELGACNLVCVNRRRG